VIDIIIAAFLGLGVVICCAFMAIIQVFLNGYERRQVKPVYKSELERIMEEIEKGTLHV
jgi:hypothetical protein